MKNTWLCELRVGTFWNVTQGANAPASPLCFEHLKQDYLS
jgi:hypothetical protein